MSEIILENVFLRYPLYGMGPRSIKRDIVNLLRGNKKDQADKITYVDALKNINLHLKAGDYLGLVGHNGAGKSTLLRLLSKIYEPIEGKLRIQGEISSLLGGMVGMQPELTGYENIKINSIIKNYSKAQTTRIISDIEEFTELGNFLRLPVKIYSAGMQARLAFAISTAIHPDILLLDEVVGTGDAQFMNKAKDRMHNLLRKANILVLATHNTEILKQFCNKIMWLDHGEIKAFGSVDETINQYLADTEQKTTTPRTIAAE